MQNDANLVVCPCQICGGGIQFDASSFGVGGTQNCECPHCKMETTLFVPQKKADSESIPKPETTARTALIEALGKSLKLEKIIWITTGALFIISLCTTALSNNSGSGGFLSLLVGIGVFAGIFATRKRQSLHERLNPPKPNYICSNCGTLLTWQSKTPPKSNDVCGECKTNATIPLGTPRGQELFATYHGKLTARERVESNDEAIRKILNTLEPISTSGGLAADLEKLAALVQTGAITREEWQKAKALYLGHPKDVQQNTLARIQQLHGLCQTGALSESEFNSVKWDILAKGMTKGFN